jgi:hypothetical protein
VGATAGELDGAERVEQPTELADHVSLEAHRGEIVKWCRALREDCDGSPTFKGKPGERRDRMNLQGGSDAQ